MPVFRLQYRIIWLHLAFSTKCNSMELKLHIVCPSFWSKSITKSLLFTMTAQIRTSLFGTVVVSWLLLKSKISAISVCHLFKKDLNFAITSIKCIVYLLNIWIMWWPHICPFLNIKCVYRKTSLICFQLWQKRKLFFFQCFSNVTYIVTNFDLQDVVL